MDVLTRQFFENNENFAAAVNGYLFRGRKVVSAEDVKELDVTETRVDKNGRLVKNTRDIAGRVVVRRVNDICCVIIGIEDQQKIDYTMPLRCLRVDSMRYDQQLRRIKNEHRTKNDLKIGTAEYQCHFSKSDKVLPVITIVVYWGSEPWDGPHTLYDMMDMPEDSELLHFISDYRVNLIDAHSMSEHQLREYGEKLGYLLGLVKASKDRLSMREYIKTPSKVLSDYETRALAEKVVNHTLPSSKEEDEDMRNKAFEEVLKEEWDAGHIKGREEGCEEKQNAFILSMRKNGIPEEQIQIILKDAKVVG